MESTSHQAWCWLKLLKEKPLQVLPSATIPTFLQTGSSFDLPLTNEARWSGQWVQESSASASPVLGLEPSASLRTFLLPCTFPQVPGKQYLRSLCLQGKDLIDWAIDPVSSTRTRKMSLPRSAQERLHKLTFMAMKLSFTGWILWFFFCGLAEKSFLCFTGCLLISPHFNIRERKSKEELTVILITH